MTSKNKTVALTLSGANVDPETYREMLAADGHTSIGNVLRKEVGDAVLVWEAK